MIGREIPRISQNRTDGLSAGRTESAKAAKSILAPSVARLLQQTLHSQKNTPATSRAWPVANKVFCCPNLVKLSVLIVGSFNQDLAFEVKEFPRPGDEVMGEFRPSPGGKGFNQAVAATRAGVPTLFCGAVGPDAFGASAHKFAHDAGIEAHFITKPKHTTGVAVITVNAEGENQIIVSPGANFGLRPHDIPIAFIKNATVVVCQGETNYATVAHVLRVARKSGAITVFNPAPMRAGFDVALLRHTEVLIPNEAEFIALLKLRPRSAALLRATSFAQPGGFTEDSLATLKGEMMQQLCRSLDVPVVIVTLGDHGCFVSQPDVFMRVNAHAIEVVDTTGAGDAFVGGFAAGLVKFKHNIFEAAHYASAVAALSVLQPGAAPAMPIAREIARFLKKRDHS